MTESAELFGVHRPLLFGVAYRMLGSASDADDVLQDAYLRWHRAQTDGEVIASSRGWLATVVTRLCIDHLRSARVSREQYVGPWLPEPFPIGEEPDLADGALRAESISTAFLVLLERLTPKERAIFVLHDVFSYPYAEIATTVDETEANCRQLARRARAHLAAGRPRFAASASVRQRLTEQFGAATLNGDLSALIATLTEDVVVWSDGGADARASRRPISGAERVGRFLLGIRRTATPTTEVSIESFNGRPGLVARENGLPFVAISFEVDQDRISQIYIVVNPDKLRALGSTATPRH